MNSINSRQLLQDTDVLAGVKIELYHQYQIAFEPTEKIFSMMSLLNSTMYCVASKYGILKRCTNGGRTLVTEKIPQLVQDMDAGAVTVSIPVSHWQDYLKRYWVDACNSLPFLRKLRDKFAEMGLFSFQKQKPGSTRKPPELQCVDVVRILALYELLEDTLKERGYTIDDIGVYTDKDGNKRSHKGGVMKLLYEAILHVAYRRQAPLEPLVQAVEEVPEAVWREIEEKTRRIEREELLRLYGDLELPH